jgi:para-aminobenzoate synthetase
MVGSDSIEFVGTDETVKLPFLGGLVGYVGYEMKAETLKLSKTQHEFQTKYADDIPDTSFLFADRLICYDHQFSKLYLVTLVNDPNNNAIDKKNQKLWTNTMKHDIQSLSMQVKPFGAFDEIPVKKIPQVKLVHEKKDYIDMIEQSLQKIKEGETYEVCLTTQLKAVLQKPHPSPFEMYKHLRKRNPAPYAAYFSFGKDLVVTSSSPERYLRIDDKNKISMKPIKGTLKTANSSNFNGTLQEIKEENERRRVKLATSEKDQSENLMVFKINIDCRFNQKRSKSNL